MSVGESVLDLSNVLADEFCYNYMIPKWCKKRRNLTQTYNINKINWFFKIFANNAGKWFDTLNYNELPTGKTKKVISLMKDAKGVKIIENRATKIPETYGFRVQKDDHEIEEPEFIKAKGVENVCISRANISWFWSLCSQWKD